MTKLTRSSGRKLSRATGNSSEDRKTSGTHCHVPESKLKSVLVSVDNHKCVVERKKTIQHMEDTSRRGSQISTTTPPSSLFQRSTSHDGVLRNRVTIKSDKDDDDDNDTEKIDKYYQKNHYTVTGAHQNTFNQLPRNVSANRFQVDKAESDKIAISCKSSVMGETTSVLPVEREFSKSFYWFAMHRKKFGFRYLALCLIAVAYTLFGALVFYLIEGSHELSRLRVREAKLDELLDHLASVISEAVNNPDKTTEHLRMKEFIRNSYIELQKQEEQYKWSTYYRLEHPDNLKWTFSSSFFFSMNIYTTTGYGSISAQTTAGQLFTMCYAFCFVPMTLVILRDLGQMFLVNFTKLYAHALTLVRRIKGKREIDDDEMIQLPIKFCMAILGMYLLLCTTFVYLYDAVMGPEWDDGLPYFTAFYFSFISLTTIGLGDVMPNNVPYAPPVSIIFFIGMAVTKVVNRATYIAVENGVFGIMTLAETRIDNLIRGKRSTQSDGTGSSRSDKSSDGSSGSSSDNESLSDSEDRRDEGRRDNQIDRQRNQLMNTFTVRSIATFMRSNHDVYGGGFGRVQLRRGDLLNTNNAHTVAGVSRNPRV